jgi:Cft2 family RNA processing exonuclease
VPFKIFFDGNINIEVDGKKIALDPEIKTNADLIFISHAHLDHAPNIDTVTPKICSQATKELVQYRKNFQLINTISFETFDINGIHFKQLNSGHIIGSKSLLLETKNKRIFYTGDISDKHRFYLKAAEVPKNDVMIIETTFGIPEYQFPGVMDVIDKSTKWIKEQLESNYSVALLGYPLGKAQIISKIAENFEIPIVVHDKIFEINEICKKHGFDGNGYIKYSEFLNFLEKENFIGIFPCSSYYVNFLNEMKKSVKIAAFSGWALDPKYKESLNVDEAFVLSDHSDFNGLVKIVKQASPEKIYTIHGFENEFAGFLRENLGFDAQPLTKKKNLVDFI